MAIQRVCVICLVLWLSQGANLVGADAPVALRERAEVGQVTQALVELKAEGLYRPNATPGKADAKPSKALALKVQTRLTFVQKVLAVGADGGASRVARKVARAASAINGEIRPSASQIRPEVSLLFVERRAGHIRAFSPGGPLTRSELELVEGAGDPLMLAALLPAKPVSKGDHWTVGTDAARSLSGYDALASNRLEATLEDLDDGSATLKLKGEVRGAALGGEGAITFNGQATFDRKIGRFTGLNLSRREVRKAGPVEAGLEMTSTLTVDQRTAETPPELGDEILGELPTDASAARLLLLFEPPEGKYTLLHDRSWHLFWDDRRVAVLKRLDQGEVVAQCNLSVGPEAGKGRHQDPNQFRDDIRRALGTRFGQVLGAGEVEGPPGGGFRYRVAVAGLEGEVGILWYYYLLASPAGDQLVATFTLGQAQTKAFADQDAQLIGSVEWKDVAAPAPTE
ncbi:MAG: hypothetical protein ABI353_17360 [Isosphaeraceae bacterium]